jgi:pilus assembly protein FimV
MNMRLRLPIALALALGSSHASALGLGQIEVKSALNQPLVAEIPVLTSSPGEADDLRVKLAAPDAFTRVGLDRPTLQAANLNFEVRTDERGRKVIRITTPSAVSDPFLSFLLEADWGKGRMLREYTVLLDPPSMVPITASAPARTSALPEPPPAPTEALLETPPPLAAEPIPEPQPLPTPAPIHETPVEPVAVAPAPVPEPAAEPAPAPATAAVQQDSYPTYGADSYGPVVSGDTLWSIAQRTRHDEAITINQMMLALLRANPEAFADNNINRLRKGAVLRIPAREEATILAASEAAAQVRDQMQAWGGGAATFASPADASMSAPTTSRSVADRRSDSRLELTPPRGEGSASASQSGAAADGSGRELRAELARSREEVSALSQENVELKSRVGELEDIQSESRRLLELKDSELAAAQRRLAEAEATRSASAEAAPAAATDPLATEATPLAAVDESAAATPAPAEEASPDAAAAEPVAEIVAEQTAPPAATPEPIAEAAPTPAPQPSAGPFGLPPGFNPWLVGGGAAVLLGLIGLLLARRRKTPAAAATAAPSATAVAAAPAVAPFEPDPQEGDLIEAISHYPDDLHLHLDLLKHYVDRGENEAFEMAAEAMYAQVRDLDDPIWREAVAMGQQIAPHNPLFEAAGPDDGADESEASHDDTRSFETAAPTPTPASRDVDWLHGTAATVADAGSQAVDQDFDDFDFEPVTEAGGDAEPGDFVEAAPLADDDAMDSDVAATKLELARAYLDMGDAEGARGMLEEVLTEGNSAQREEARALIATIH